MAGKAVFDVIYHRLGTVFNIFSYFPTLSITEKFSLP